MRNRAGFSAQDWKVAYNQVKALSDRHQLDERALMRFARFGYGHHAAAALTRDAARAARSRSSNGSPAQDYVAITVALRALGITPGPVRGADRDHAVARHARPMPTRPMSAAASKRSPREEAQGIFELWRTHAFRRRVAAEERVA